MFALAGLTGIFLYMWAFNAGTALVPSGVAGFIIASCPVFTLIFAIIFLKERTTRWVWLGVAVSFVGVVVIAATQITERFALNLGIGLLLGAAVSTSIFFIIQKVLLKKYTIMQVTAYPILFGTAFMLIFLPSLLDQWGSAAPAAHITVVYLGIFPAAIAYFLWNYALANAQKTVHVTSMLYLSPFLASLMAFIWLGEHIPPLAYIGGVVIITGLIITNFLRRERA